MAVIEPGSPAITESSLSYWQDQKTNTQILIYELDKAILKLEREDRESYSIDTGQTSQSVKRVNLASLIKERTTLQTQMREIESIIDRLTSRGGNFIQVVPY